MKSNHNHNIDKLFAQKLDSLEDAPSENAWLTIGKGLEQKKNKKKGIWLPYATAAAVALLIVSVVWMREQAQNPDVVAVVAQNPVVPGKAGQIKARVQPEKSTEKQPRNSYIAGQDIQKQEAVAQPEQPSSRENPVVRKVEKPVFSQKKRAKTEAIMRQLPVLEEKLAILIPSQETVPVNTFSQSNTIVVTVALGETDVTDEPESEAAQVVEKQSKAGKLLGKLKQLKRGEFDELGIRKETLVAFVKEKTHNPKSQSSQE